MKQDLRTAFLKAYDDYADAIYRHAFFRLSSEARAEELMQDTFLRTWRYLAEGNDIANLRAFLYRTLNNLIVDEYRRKKEESLDALMETAEFYEPSRDTRADLEDQVLLTDVREAIERLPEEDRELVLLRYVNDLSPADIGEVMGMTPGNVSVRLHRIVKVLMKDVNPSP